MTIKIRTFFLKTCIISYYRTSPFTFNKFVEVSVIIWVIFYIINWIFWMHLKWRLEYSINTTNLDFVVVTNFVATQSETKCLIVTRDMGITIAIMWMVVVGSLGFFIFLMTWLIEYVLEYVLNVSAKSKLKSTVSLNIR